MTRASWMPGMVRSFRVSGFGFREWLAAVPGFGAIQRQPETRNAFSSPVEPRPHLVRPLLGLVIVPVGLVRAADDGDAVRPLVERGEAVDVERRRDDREVAALEHAVLLHAQ